MTNKNAMMLKAQAVPKPRKPPVASVASGSNGKSARTINVSRLVADPYSRIQKPRMRSDPKAEATAVNDGTIAEMGKSGRDRVALHFEIRKLGIAVDPEPYLRGEVN